MTNQVLIASYQKDFVWLGPCLASLKKFSRGFLPPVISVAPNDYIGAREIADRYYPETEVLVHCDQRGLAKGNLRAQLSMMNGDVLCRDADYVWLVGSDCIVQSEFSPEPFFKDGKPAMLINSYEHLFKYVPRENLIPWQMGVERALGYCPNYEYMRRLPLMYPRELFRFTREAVCARHACNFTDYVYDVHSPTSWSNFSESNILGAFAHKYEPALFEWIDIDNRPDPIPNPLIQFWSHGGLDRIADLPFSGKSWLGKTPRQIITGILGADALA